MGMTVDELNEAIRNLTPEERAVFWRGVEAKRRAKIRVVEVRAYSLKKGRARAENVVLAG